MIDKFPFIVSIARGIDVIYSMAALRDCCSD